MAALFILLMPKYGVPAMEIIYGSTSVPSILNQLSCLPSQQARRDLALWPT